MNRLMKDHISANKLRILILTWEYPPNVVGGLSRHVKGLSTALADLGHDVYVITAHSEFSADFEILDGVKVYRVSPLNQQEDNFLTWIAGLNLAMAFKAEKIAKDTKFDIIHAHDWLVGSAAITLKEGLSIPLLTTIHAHEYGRNNGIYTEIQQFIHSKEQQLVTESDQLIVCSEYMREELTSIFQIKTEKVVVIANGIEVPEIKAEPYEFFPFLCNQRYIFSMGRIVREKGFETIIEAAAIGKETGQELFFVIAGKGPMLEVYRQMVIERNLESNVRFIGYVTDEQRNALLECSELTVFPSLYEPFGIVALESMILGKPTVVSETGGLMGIVRHLHNGMLMVPGDAQSMLDNITFLINNPQKGQQIGEKGRKIAKSLYGWKRIANQTVQVVEDTLVNKLVSDNKAEKSLIETSNNY